MTDQRTENTGPGLRAIFFSLCGIASAALLVIAVPMTAAGRDPFVTWHYVICWYSIILFLDSVRALCGNRSLIFGRPLVFGALLFWSAVTWFFFEAMNCRVANWYYVYVSPVAPVRIAGCFLSFATVFPALFLIEGLLEDMGLFAKATCRRLRVGRRAAWVVALCGIVSLVLPLLWPRWFFPLLWIGVALLLAPLNRKRLENSLLGDFEKGSSRRFLRILAAGMICGAVWEVLNFFARTQWIYTVPFFEELKIFEMPLPGYLGFAPFAVECAVVWACLSSFGLAPSLGRAVRRAGIKPLALSAVIPVWALAAIGAWFAFQGMLSRSVDSYTPRLADLDLPAAVADFADKTGCEDIFQLNRVLADPVNRRILEQEGVDMNALSGLAGLAAFRGIGAGHAKALVRIGVGNTVDLAGCDADDLAERLAEEEGRAISPSRVRVWIRAARRRFEN